MRRTFFFTDLDVITPQISISPNVNVVEGDRVQITCNVQLYSDLRLYLTRDKTILRVSHTNFTHSLVVRSEDSRDYVCKAEKGSVQKKTSYQLNVTGIITPSFYWKKCASDFHAIQLFVVQVVHIANHLCVFYLTFWLILKCFQILLATVHTVYLIFLC